MELYTKNEIDKLLKLQFLKGEWSLTQEEINSSLNNLSSTKPTTLDIIDAVAKVMRCTYDEVLSKNRTSLIVKLKHYVCYFAYYYSDDTLYGIKFDLDYANHASVVHAAHKINDGLIYRDVDVDCALILNQLRSSGFKTVKSEKDIVEEKPKFYRISHRWAHKKGKPIYRVDLDGTRSDYLSIASAADEHKLSVDMLQRFLRREDSFYKGAWWYYLNKDI